MIEYQEGIQTYLRNRLLLYRYIGVDLIDSDISLAENGGIDSLFKDDFTIEASNVLLLLWTRIGNPEARKKIMYLWARALPELPTMEAMTSYTTQLCQARRPDEIQARIKEYGDIYPIVLKESNELARTSLSISIKIDYPELDILINYRDPPFYSAFFTPSKEMRSKLYESFPKEYDPTKEYDPHMAIVKLLWLFEPDKELRREKILPLLGSLSQEATYLRLLVDQCENQQKRDRYEEIKILQEIRKHQNHDDH